MERIQDILAQLTARAGDVAGALGAGRAFILDHFGQNGLIAAYIVAGVLAFVIIYRLIKITIAAIKYLVIPAVVLAFLATIFLPYSFTTCLPVTVTACSLILLIKG